MEEYKQYKKDFSKLGWMFVIGTLIIYGVQILTVLAVNTWRPAWLSDGNMSLMISMLPMYLISMPILIVLVRRLPGRAPEKHKMTAGQFLLALIICFAIMYCSNLIGTIITSIIGMLKGSSVDNVILDIAMNTNVGLRFLYMVVCAPIFEEFIFRKLIVDKTIRYGQGTAIFLSGLMFGLFHGNLGQFAYAFTLGMFLAFLYVKTGQIKITIIMHMIINFMGGIVSILVMEMIHYDELMEVTVANDQQAVMNMVMDNIAGWMVYLVYIAAIFCMVIAGIVLMIVFRKRFSVQPGEIVLLRGKRFRTIFLNTGMVMYCLFWVGMIIAQLFGV